MPGKFPPFDSITLTVTFPIRENAIVNINEMGSGFPEPIHSGSRKINPPHFRTADIEMSGQTSGAGADRIQHARDPEVIRLVQSMNQSPEVRSERVAEIQQRLLAGDFLTRQAAEQTADAILNK